MSRKEELADEYEKQFHKDYPDGVSIQSYCNAEFPSTIFLAGWDARSKDVEELVEALEFTLHATEYLYKPDKELRKNLDPTFYFTLTYEGDLELIEKTKRAREALAKYRGEK